MIINLPHQSVHRGQIGRLFMISSEDLSSSRLVIREALPIFPLQIVKTGDIVNEFKISASEEQEKGNY